MTWTKKCEVNAINDFIKQKSCWIRHNSGQSINQENENFLIFKHTLNYKCVY